MSENSVGTGISVVTALMDVLQVAALNAHRGAPPLPNDLLVELEQLSSSAVLIASAVLAGHFLRVTNEEDACKRVAVVQRILTARTASEFKGILAQWTGMCGPADGAAGTPALSVDAQVIDACSGDIIQQQARLDTRVKQVIQAIHADIANRPRIRSLAGKVCLSVSRLEHLFCEVVGCSMTEYVSAVRMARAAYLLRSTSMRVSEVADAVGIHDSSNFSKLFSKSFGRSPRAYRLLNEFMVRSATRS